MKDVFAVALALLLPFPGRGSSEGGRQASAPLSVVVAARVEKLGPGSLWPGFEPARIPLAIFDGERTYLFRHPSPPPEFQPLAGLLDARYVSGQHALVRANTSVVIGGVRTATLLLDVPEKRSERDLASLAAHEMFHVFEAERHPAWGGNEVDLFTYPVDDTGQLQISRLEVEALRRALAAKRVHESACWTSAALELRRRRFAALGEKGAAYERGTELNEGLARLVETRARGDRRPESVLPKEDFPAGEVRSRSYSVGHALGVLLDRFASGWERRLESGEDRPLDVLLQDAVAASASARCRFTRAENDEALSLAQRSVELAQLTRRAVRRDFLERPGWKIVVVAGAEPLSPERFDPLNVDGVAPGEVLHSRWVKLGNTAGSLEVLNRRALTESAGKHPLFEGVRRVIVTGLPDEPQVRESSGALFLRADGVTGDFRGARLVREDRTITILLGKAR